MESHQENWWRGVWRDLRRNRPRDQGAGRTQVGVGKATKTGMYKLRILSIRK